MGAITASFRRLFGYCRRANSLLGVDDLWESWRGRMERRRVGVFSEGGLTDRGARLCSPPASESWMGPPEREFQGSTGWPVQTVPAP